MKKVIALLFLLLPLGVAAQHPIELPVWPNGAAENPGFDAPAYEGEWGLLFNVDTARIFVYRPEPARNTGTAVLICPGGGYQCLAIGHEGHAYAQWLAQNGITGVVLRYRLPNGHWNIPLSDAQEAMKIVRRNAEAWGIDPHKIGVSGFSAGGHLASTLGTHYDRESRPDFLLLIYPVVTFRTPDTHFGSRQNLLGSEVNNEALVNDFSNERQVTPQTPPAFLVLSDDDTAVPPANSIAFYESLKRNGVPASLNILPGGYHGWGMRDDFTYAKEWKSLLLKWLQTNRLISAE